MARRLPGHEPLRGEAVEIRISDATVRAHATESLAAAALVNGTHVLSRSLKYHRPRASFCFEGHCSGCLVRISGVPNLRACQTPCTNGAEVTGQNAFPSAQVDLLGAVDFLFRRGMDHHTLMTGSSVLNKLANKVVRHLSGLGKLPSHGGAELPEVGRFGVDVCVIGGGPAGLAAATAAATAGSSVLVVDDQLRPGGSLRADPRGGRTRAEQRWTEAIAAGVTVLARATAIGYFAEDDGGVLAVAAPDRLYRVYARRWIWATGGYAQNLPFPDNDRPGVIAARGLGRLLVDHGILGGDKICVIELPALDQPALPVGSAARGAGATLGEEMSALAAALAEAGAEVSRVALSSVEGTRGRGWVHAVDTADRRYECDLVAVAAIPAPASEGARQQGCQVVLDPAAGGFKIVVDEHGHTSVPNVWACGDVCGYVGTHAAALHGASVGAQVARS